MIVKSLLSGPYGPTEYPDGLMWMLVVRTDKGDQELFFSDLADCLNLVYELKEGPVRMPNFGETF